MLTSGVGGSKLAGIPAVAGLYSSVLPIIHTRPPSSPKRSSTSRCSTATPACAARTTSRLVLCSIPIGAFCLFCNRAQRSLCLVFGGCTADRNALRSFEDHQEAWQGGELQEGCIFPATCTYDQGCVVSESETRGHTRSQQLSLEEESPWPRKRGASMHPTTRWHTLQAGHHAITPSLGFGRGLDFLEPLMDLVRPGVDEREGLEVVVQDADNLAQGRAAVAQAQG